MEINSMTEELKFLERVCTGSQKAFYTQMLKDAKIVKVSPLSEVFTKEEIANIKRAVKPQIKQCYRNATLASIRLNNVEYCEGKMRLDCGLSIDHAFNKIGDKYIDITAELVLNYDVTKLQYLVLGEYTPEEVARVSLKTNVYGDIYRYYYINKNKKDGKRN